jgi:hypothetical protein
MAGVRGRRVRRSKQQWVEIVRRCEASGIGKQQFCARNGIALSSLLRWRQRLAVEPSADFVELVPSSESSSSAMRWTLEVSLPSGVSLRFQG